MTSAAANKIALRRPQKRQHQPKSILLSKRDERLKELFREPLSICLALWSTTHSFDDQCYSSSPRLASGASSLAAYCPFWDNRSLDFGGAQLAAASSAGRGGKAIIKGK